MFKKAFISLLLLPFSLYSQEVFMYGQDTICSNGGLATVYLDFQNRGVPPYTVVYSINNVIQTQDTIFTDLNLYQIKTKKQGSYKLVYFSDSDTFNGVDSTNGMATVTIKIAPTAIIELDNDTLSVLLPSTNLINNSIGNIVQQVWNYGDNTGNDTVNNPFHTFPIDEISTLSPFKYFPITLFVEDSNGCFDTVSHNILIREEYWMFIPNSFTPDNDKLNDKFCIEFRAIRENTFLFKVYNAQGDLMYQSTDPNSLRCSFNGGWEGRHYKTGKSLLSDTYVYELYFQDFEGWKHKDFGQIILTR